jgi:hypothetical protein
LNYTHHTPHAYGFKLDECGSIRRLSKICELFKVNKCKPISALGTQNLKTRLTQNGDFILQSNFDRLGVGAGIRTQQSYLNRLDSSKMAWKAPTALKEQYKLLQYNYNSVSVICTILVL